MSKKLIQEQFIDKARKIHSDKYDYSKAIYINKRTKIIITCPIHGEFLQLPLTHTKGSGCPKCNNVKVGDRFRSNTQEFLEKAKLIHQNKFDYSKTKYVNVNEKVIIICSEHGDFLQTPESHLSGAGCAKCHRENLSLARRSNTQEFIEKARIVHGNRYDYTKTKYTGIDYKLLIHCYLHGEFTQIASDHLQGSGCPKCNNIKIGDRFRSNTQEFLEKAKLIHGDKYGYDKVVYVNNSTKVIIICPIHGEFEQTPDSHLQGSSCSKCGYEKNSISSRSNAQEFIEKAKVIHGNKYDYSKVIYVNSCTKVIITCKKHGNWKQTPSNHLHGAGCPICKSSKGELAIIDILKKHNIKFTREYLIPEIANNLYYDFHLPDYNLLIEFHGIQHYEYVPFLHKYDEDNFLAQKTRDAVVKSNARQFRYRYLEFNYKQLKYMTKEQFEEMVIKSINKYRKE